jgi:hypothetical protein
MEKSINKTSKKDTRRAAFIKDTAELAGVSQRQAQRVLAGDQENETVISVFMEIQEGYTALLDAVKQLVPFN